MTLACVFVANAQNDGLKMQKPKVMVVPEEAYCINSGYSKTAADGTTSAYVLALSTTAIGAGRHQHRHEAKINVSAVIVYFYFPMSCYNQKV